MIKLDVMNKHKMVVLHFFKHNSFELGKNKGTERKRLQKVVHYPQIYLVYGRCNFVLASWLQKHKMNQT
jgi:hypothetical protein